LKDNQSHQDDEVKRVTEDRLINWGLKEVKSYIKQILSLLLYLAFKMRKNDTEDLAKNSSLVKSYW